MLDFYNLQKPKARKEYKCDLCSNPIHKGEIYIRYSGKYDGEMFNDKYHLNCKKIIDTYCNEVSREYNSDSIQEWLHDKYCCGCEEYENCCMLELHCPNIMKNYEND